MQASSISFTSSVSGFPSTFRGVTALTSSTPGRFRDQSGLIFVYLYSIILGDNESVPLQPILENSDPGGNNDIQKFLVWPRSTKRHFMTLAFDNVQSITAINIEFLNYPAQGSSLPS